MVEKVLNDWLESTMRKVRNTVEDADRKSHSARVFETLLRDVHGAMVACAIRAEHPKIERFQNDNQVTLRIEWLDEKSGWFLNFDVVRVLGEKPKVHLAMSGNPDDYECAAPTENDVRKALIDYFQEWKRA